MEQGVVAALGASDGRRSAALLAVRAKRTKSLMKFCGLSGLNAPAGPGALGEEEDAVSTCSAGRSMVPGPQAANVAESSLPESPRHWMACWLAVRSQQSPEILAEAHGIF